MLTWTPARWQRASSLLDDALARPDDARAAFLRAACPDDDALRAEVEAMLALEVHDHALLDAGAAAVGGPLVAQADADARAGATVGRYRLVRPLGRGGMGVVYLAERADGQFRQQVALKLLTRAAPAAVRRFRAERQILATLDQPGVARLLDGGVADPTPAHPDGVPFLVMEHVAGAPLTDYARRHALGVEACLRLVLDVANAVQHAHRKLVIHRDLKPSNILVAEDAAGRPQVKLLDFGIAKLLGGAGGGDGSALAPGLTPVTTATGLGLMTPAYAAPEQVTGAPCDVTTDVYQLGVVLYELLTGTRPFDLDGATPTEAARAICEDAPAPPSEAAARADDAPTRARAATLRGDLDTLVLTALRKDPARRYASAEAFAADVRRYLDGRPLAARPDSTTYRLRLFARRNRAPLAVAVAIAVLLVVLGVRERVLRTEAEAARAVAVEERARAEREAATAATAVDFLVGLFDAADPVRQDEGDVTAQTLLARGVRRVDDDLAAQPAVRATLLDAMGRAYHGLGRLDSSHALLERARALRRELPGDARRAEAAALEALAAVRFDQGNRPAADSLYQQALTVRRSLPDSAALIATLVSRSDVLRMLGRSAEGEAALREAVALTKATAGPHSPEAARLIGRLAQHLLRTKTPEAFWLYRHAVAILRAQPGPPSVALADALEDAGVDLMSSGAGEATQARRRESIQRLREALAIKRERLGSHHPSTVSTLKWLALAQDDLQLATEAGRRDLRLKKARYGPDHLYLVSPLGNLADLFRKQGRIDTALVLLQHSVRILRQKETEEMPLVMHLLNTGDLLRAAGRPLEACLPYREALDVTLRLARGAAGHPVDPGAVARSKVRWGACLVARGAYDEARPVLTESLRLLARGNEAYVPGNRALAVEQLAALHAAQGRPQRAVAWRDSLQAQARP